MKKYLRRCGIASGRVYTDEEARSTSENAVNTFRIMKQLGIETYTLVTSDYHQLWGQVLFTGVGAVYEKRTGWTARPVGNYSHPTWQAGVPSSGGRSGLVQLASLFSGGIRVDP